MISKKLSGDTQEAETEMVEIDKGKLRQKSSVSNAYSPVLDVEEADNDISEHFLE